MVFLLFLQKCFTQTLENTPATLGFMIPLLIAFLLFKARRSRLAVRRSLPLCLISAWAVSHIFSMTLLTRELGSAEKCFELEFLWSYKKAILEGSQEAGMEIAANILLFMPAAVFLPMLFPVFDRLWRVAVSACLLSLCIELTQGIFGMGLFEFDDILNNTMGAVLGYGILRGARRLRRSGL